MRKKTIKVLYSKKYFHWLLWIFHRLVGRNHYKGIGNGNTVQSYTANIYKNHFHFVKGTNNEIVIGDNSDLHNSTILCKGSNNKVVIGANGFVNGVKLVLEGDNNTVIIGDNAFILDNTRIVVVDGSTLKIGDGCMFSDHIEIRTTDNHSIIDKSTGERINPEEDIIICNDVWIGMHVIVLKGAELADGSIVGSGSLITRKHIIPNSIIVGSPGVEVKSNVEWKMERI